MSKEREKWILDQFIELIDSDLSNIKESESPDSIAIRNRRTIGIELTEIFQDSSSGFSKMKQNSAETELLTELIMTYIFQKVKFTFLIGINYKKNLVVSKSQRNQVAKKIADFCIPFTLNLTNHENIELDYYSGVPDEIVDIYISRFDEMDEPCNMQPEGGSVKSMTNNDVQAVLTSKESKLRNYQKCDEYWLIIREGNYYAGAFSEILIETPINSLFDKVFLLRTAKSRIVELK